MAHRGAVADREVVVHRDGVPARQQQLDGVRPDIPRPARHENPHDDRRYLVTDEHG